MVNHVSQTIKIQAYFIECKLCNLNLNLLPRTHDYFAISIQLYAGELLPKCRQFKATDQVIVQILWLHFIEAISQFLIAT